MAEAASKNRGSVHIQGSTEFEVFYEDTDFSGFVYHANYLKYFERARERIIGLKYLQELHQRGVHFVVARVQMTYRAPAKHADIVRIESEVTATRSPTHTYTQKAFVEETLCVEARITIANLNADNKPIRLPLDVMETMIERGGSWVEPPA